MTSIRKLWRVVPVLFVATSASAQLFKCTDEHGRSTYSDKMCPEVRRSSLTEVSRRGSSVAQSTGPIKLTPSSVEAVVRHATSLAMRGDYQAQCALAAPELRFRTTEMVSSPPKVTSGGKSELCLLQRKSAIGLQDLQANIVLKLGKLDINVQPDGNRASVKYDVTGAVRIGGETAMMLRCSRSETLGIFGGEILYVQTESVCYPGA